MAIEKFEKRLLKGSFKVACKYEDKSVRYWETSKEIVVSQIAEIVNQYSAMGHTLTLRQLHYQFVSRNWIVNHDTAYKKLGRILDDCRYGGVIDWDSIEDRGRVPKLPYWVTGIPDALNDTINNYRLNRQQGQDTHIEVWTEKDALSGIMFKSTAKFHVRLVINKGYTSSSSIYDAYERFAPMISEGQKVTVLYFGDHDPSGLDMIRDVRERLQNMFANGDRLSYLPDKNEFEVIPIGLTMSQIKKYKCPSNPTKMTDLRAAGYVEKYGKTSWEVDALPPEALTEILEHSIISRMDVDLFNEMLAEEKADKKKLKTYIDSYEKE